MQYVLSDKTGTLTQNVMGFVWASVAGKLYGQAQHAQQAAQQAAAAASKRAPAPYGSSSSKYINTVGADGALAAAAAQTSSSKASNAVGSGGGAGGVVIEADGSAVPPPNTPHTISLDADMRAAAKAAAAGACSSADAAVVGDFLLALALCNTVVPTATDAGQLLYQVGLFELELREVELRWS